MLRSFIAECPCWAPKGGRKSILCENQPIIASLAQLLLAQFNRYRVADICQQGIEHFLTHPAVVEVPQCASESKSEFGSVQQANGLMEHQLCAIPPNYSSKTPIPSPTRPKTRIKTSPPCHPARLPAPWLMRSGKSTSCFVRCAMCTSSSWWCCTRCRRTSTSRRISRGL